MEENEIIMLRKPKKNGVKAALIGVGTGVIFLGIDLLFYFRHKAMGRGVVLEIVFMVISCIYLAVALLFLLFARSFAKANAKLANKPVISYNKEEDAFIVYNLIDLSEQHIKNSDLLCVSAFDDGDIHIKYKKDDKEEEFSIGYGDQSDGDMINLKIAEIRARGRND